jgi:hypothetical protein
MTGSSLVLLVVGFSIGGTLGWYAGHRAGISQDDHRLNGKAELASAADVHGNRSARRNSEKPEEDGSTNFPANSKDFAKSVRAIFRENVKERRVALFEKMAQTVGLEHFPGLVALVRENDLRGNDTGDEWKELWTNWAERDPTGAMNFIYQFDWSGWDPAAPAQARNSTLANWAQIDPQAVRKFVEEGKELANGDRSMVLGFVEGWSNVDPIAAADWLFKSGLGKSSEFEKVIQAMTRSGSQGSVDAWFAGLDPTVVSAEDLKGFARAISRQRLEYEPEKAAAWLESHLKEPWAGDSEIVGNTAQALALRDPRAAMEWAGKTGLNQATYAATNAWCQIDLNAASQWMNENSQNPTYSDSAQIVMLHLQQRDPAAARSWAEGLANKALGEELLKISENPGK